MKEFTSHSIKQENEIVPYDTQDIPSGKWVVFAPHQDDEIIGMGGALLLAKEKNIDITLVVVTDGSLGGADTLTRENELKKVAKELKIQKLFFLGHKDRNIVINHESIKEVKKILKECNANVVFLPSAMELHPDHRMSTELVWRALHEVDKTFEVFAYEISVQNQINLLVDITAVIENKKSLLELYKSQTKENDYIDFMISLNRLRAYTLPNNVKYAEGFYKYENYAKESYQKKLSKIFETYTKEYTGDLKDFVTVQDKNSPLVSVIIPCYNDGKYLQEALDSLYLQTYDNIEIIVVNDSSTDHATIEILDKIKSNNLKLIHMDKNRGPSAARNHGIEKANGRYILPLDSDDKIDSSYIQKAVTIMESNASIGLVYCEAELFGKQSNKWELPEYSLKDILIGNMIFVTALFKKEDWHKVGGYKETIVLGWEDYEFWLSLLELEIKVVQIKEVLFYYRIKELSRSTATTLINNQILMHKQIISYHKNLYCNNIENLIEKIYEYKHMINLKNQEIEQILFIHSQELHNITNSRGWRFILFVRKLKGFFNA